MDEMQKSMKDLRAKNDRYEKLINDLTREVRGYKDAVSEHTGSNQGWNSERLDMNKNTIDKMIN